jgi:hypothetical protein
MSAKRSEAPKVPKISQTSPPEQREGHEKYSVETSAAINSSCEIILGGGGLAAENVSLRKVLKSYFDSRFDGQARKIYLCLARI